MSLLHSVNNVNTKEYKAHSNRLSEQGRDKHWKESTIMMS